MHFYSIHVIAEYNLSGSELICRQIVFAFPKPLLAKITLQCQSGLLTFSKGYLLFGLVRLQDYILTLVMIRVPTNLEKLKN